mgnify:CR=1 FL=1
MNHHNNHNEKPAKIQIANNVKHVDYRDIETLKTFLNPHARLLGRKRTGLSAAHQRMIAQAIKRARFMGFLPYVDQ